MEGRGLPTFMIVIVVPILFLFLLNLSSQFWPAPWLIDWFMEVCLQQVLESQMSPVIQVKNPKPSSSSHPVKLIPSFRHQRKLLRMLQSLHQKHPTSLLRSLFAAWQQFTASLPIHLYPSFPLCHPHHRFLPQQHMNLHMSSPIWMIVGALGGRLITNLVRWTDA